MAEPSHAFLLRCWQEPDQEGVITWRFSLTFISEKREKKGFTDLETLVAYLQQTLSTIDSNVPGGKHSRKRHSS
jgi:hypothetical protein